MIGWLKLHRKLLNWEWYNKSEYVHLFLHILIKANFEDKKWQGIEVKKGQLVTSINHLSLETGISERSIRTILNKLKTTSELTIKTTNKFSVITIEKYSEYQCDEEKTTSKTTNKASPKRQTTDKQLTTTKEVKKEEKENKEEYIKHSADADIDFDNFWNIYDKKNDKERCIKIWNKINQSDKEKILEVLPSYIKNTPDKKYRKNPSAWLSGKRWNDEIINNTSNRIGNAFMSGEV